MFKKEIEEFNRFRIRNGIGETKSDWWTSLLAFALGRKLDENFIIAFEKFLEE